MNYFLFGVVALSALIFGSSIEVNAYPKPQLNHEQFNKVVQKRLSKLSQKRNCFEDSENYKDYKKCRKDFLKTKNIGFEKLVKNKIGQIDKMTKCLEKASDFKQLKTCKNYKKMRT